MNLSTNIREQIQGMFWGIAIGDALGMPVEGYSADKIKKEFGFITNYVSPKNHKYFSNLSPGETTDDTHLSLAVAEGLIHGNGFDLESQIKSHIEVFDRYGEHGFGRTTRTAINNLKNGILPQNSGCNGSGNGVAIKIAPLAVFSLVRAIHYCDSLWIPFISLLIDFAKMTHTTNIALAAGLTHYNCVYNCFSEEGSKIHLPCNKNPDFSMFKINNFIKYTRSFCDYANHSIPPTDNLRPRIDSLAQVRDTNQIINDFNGSYYAYDSIPFTYAFFIKNRQGDEFVPTLDNLFEVINAGGDTDSNGSMLGCLLGTLYGPNIFPSELIDGLVKKDHITKTANDFCDFLGV